MLHLEFYIGVAKYAFCAFTAACLVAFLYSFIEQLFPKVLLTRATVSYSGPRKKLGFPLALVGLLGLIASLIIYSSGSAMTGTSAHYTIAVISALVFNVGAMMYLLSEVKEERVTS